MKSPKITILIFILIIPLFGVFSVKAQGYVIEMQGTWKKPNGVIVKNRTSLEKGVEITNTSRQTGDFIILADESGDVVKSCSDSCQKMTVPSASWSTYLWCKLIFRCDKRVIVSGTKGDECVNLDAIVSLDKKGVINFSPVLDFFQNKSSNLNLRFQQRKGLKIYEKTYDLRISNPRLKGLKPGLYDVVNGSFTSRILVLPENIYRQEEPRFLELKKKIPAWEKSGLSACIIKDFTQAYLDYVKKTKRKELRKYK